MFASKNIRNVPYEEGRAGDLWRGVTLNLLVLDPTRERGVGIEEAVVGFWCERSSASETLLKLCCDFLYPIMFAFQKF